ncbi:uncharacterized protein LOC124913252 [Impatiens glandulifera]|uniref:uncharacterized protein LOC124913252 n=1 Tax=Impatiens glandulifera TaxID=253017 RepID=UPI001FB06EFB|nr:uncharacterized protein LOC124913252 [Impatiens glandulifera]
MRHFNANTGPGVFLSPSKIVKSHQFIKPEEKQSKKKASGSKSGGKKRQARKKTAPAKEKSGSKADKQLDENETADENIRQTDEDLVNQIMMEIHEQVHAASDVYFQWALYRQEIFYSNMLPEHPTDRKFEKLVEMEEEVINLTKAQSVLTALRRSSMVEQHAQLLGLTEHIQRLQGKHIPGTEDSQLELLVLDMLTVKEQEHCWKRNPSTGRHRTFPDRHLRMMAEPITNNTDHRTGTPPTDRRVSLQTEDSVPTVTEDKVKDLIEEFVNVAIRQWQKKIKETATKSIDMIESTNKELQTAVERITSVEDRYGMTDLLYNDNTRTKELEAVTKKLETDLALTSQKVGMTELNQLTTDQKLKKIDGDLARLGIQAGSTLERVAMLEEKHVKTEADLKAVTEQLAEMISAKLVADKALEEANALAAQRTSKPGFKTKRQ